MFKDINNPAASAIGQSELFVATDVLATVPSAYNHIPGGANVLYLDGHVEFSRYSQVNDGPVNGEIASVFGGIVGFLADANPTSPAGGAGGPGTCSET